MKRFVIFRYTLNSIQGFLSIQPDHHSIIHHVHWFTETRLCSSCRSSIRIFFDQVLQWCTFFTRDVALVLWNPRPCGQISFSNHFLFSLHKLNEASREDIACPRSRYPNPLLILHHQQDSWIRETRSSHELPLTQWIATQTWQLVRMQIVRWDRLGREAFLLSWRPNSERSSNISNLKDETSRHSQELVLASGEGCPHVPRSGTWFKSSERADSADGWHCARELASSLCIFNGAHLSQ
jgi:hypothetical protein